MAKWNDSLWPLKGMEIMSFLELTRFAALLGFGGAGSKAAAAKLIRALFWLGIGASI